MINDLNELLAFLRQVHKSTGPESRKKVAKWGKAVNESIKLWSRPMNSKEEVIEATQATINEL